MTVCELCGRPVRIVVRRGRHRSRQAKAGQPRALAGHTLCQRCWEREADRSWARRRKESG